jgi:hypothetical protein
VCILDRDLRTVMVRLLVFMFKYHDAYAWKTEMYCVHFEASVAAFMPEDFS